MFSFLRRRLKRYPQSTAVYQSVLWKLHLFYGLRARRDGPHPGSTHTSRGICGCRANIGWYTCLAHSVGKRVIAVEPQRQNLDCLYASLRANRCTDTEVYPLGVRDQHGMSKSEG